MYLKLEISNGEEFCTEEEIETLVTAIRVIHKNEGSLTITCDNEDDSITME